MIGLTVCSENQLTHVLKVILKGFDMASVAIPILRSIAFLPKKVEKLLCFVFVEANGRFDNQATLGLLKY